MLRYLQGQQVWLSSWDLPLKVDSRKLAPCFIGPFPIANPATVRIQPSVQISRVKPIIRSPLAPASEDPPPPQLIKGSEAYNVRHLLGVQRRGEASCTGWTGIGLGLTSFVGF